MNAYVTTNGCPENRMDCARLEVLLKGAGWTISDSAGDADLIIFNTCGLTEKTETETLDIIKSMRHKKKKDSKLIITGCLIHINKDLLDKHNQDGIFETCDVDSLIEGLQSQHTSNGFHANYLIDKMSTFLSFDSRYVVADLMSLDIYSTLTRLYNIKNSPLANSINIIRPNTYYIKICSGCSNACSYCAVKLSRGAVKSKSIVQIREELLAGLAAGFQTFALIGTDLGSYGKDIQTDLISLLGSLNSIDAVFQIKLRNVHPRYYINKLQPFIDVMKHGKVKYMESAVQSGSNRMLHGMNRGYVIEDFIHAIQSIKSALPDFKLRSQLIVGFPGETETDFQASVQLLKKVQFDFVEVYKYSPRPGTVAMTLPDQVSRRKLNKRAFALTAVA